jgi:hypothetical protein
LNSSIGSVIIASKREFCHSSSFPQTHLAFAIVFSLLMSTASRTLAFCGQFDRFGVPSLLWTIDTGMGRLGVWFEGVDAFFTHIRSCDHLKVCG